MKAKSKVEKTNGSQVMAQITNTFKRVTPVKAKAENEDQMVIDLSFSDSKNSENAP